MAELEYPRNTVWYLEVRPLDLGGGHAQEDPASMGSAVAVELQIEVVDAAGNKKREIKRYLLTCAHVVRAKTPDGEPGWGPVLGEILCFEPGEAYVRTRADSRRSGQMDGVPLATVSPLSLCGGDPGALPLNLRGPDDDWVLLEVAENALDHKAVARPWNGDVGEKKVTIIGYPGGAGYAVNAGKVHFWRNRKDVENIASEFQITRTPEAGLLLLDGMASAPGMSGGGIFTAAGELVGIHRAATHVALARDAVSIKNIQEDLWRRHRLEPVPPPPTPPKHAEPVLPPPVVEPSVIVKVPEPPGPDLDEPWWQRFKKRLLASVAGVVLVGAFLFWWLQPEPLKAQFIVKANHAPQGGIKVGLKTPQSGWSATAISDTSEATKGTLSFQIPARLRDVELHLTLPDLQPGVLFDTYRYSDIRMPVNLPPSIPTP